MKQVLLVGAGHAHLQVLRDWGRAPVPGVRLRLLTPSPQQIYSGMLPAHVAGHCTFEQTCIDAAALARDAGIEMVLGSLATLDAEQRRLTTTDGRTLDYDALSLDTGAAMDRKRIPGAQDQGLFVKPLQAFAQLWPQVVALADRKALHVVVIGGGAAGVELAMAVAHRLAGRVRVSLVSGRSGLMSRHPPPLQARCHAALRARQITVLPEDCVELLEGEVVLSNGARLVCDAPLLATGAVAPAWVAGSGLQTADDGFIATVASLQSSSHPEVFACGDVASRVDEPHPRNGVHAVRAGPVLAANLRALLTHQPLRPYRPQRRALQLLDCGDRRAIAAWGNWASAPWLGGLAWRWKRRIDQRFVDSFRVAPAMGQLRDPAA